MRRTTTYRVAGDGRGDDGGRLRQHNGEDGQLQCARSARCEKGGARETTDGFNEFAGNVCVQHRYITTHSPA